MMKRAFAIWILILFAGCAAKQPAAPPAVTGTYGRYQTTDCKTIIDTTTGLEWKIGPDQLMNFDTAKRWIEKLHECNGRCCDKAWRLPTSKELASLLQPSGEEKTSALLPQFKNLAGGENWILWADKKESNTVGKILSSTHISGGSHSGTRVGVTLSPGQSALKRPVAIRAISP